MATSDDLDEPHPMQLGGDAQFILEHVLITVGEELPIDVFPHEGFLVL